MTQNQEVTNLRHISIWHRKRFEFALRINDIYTYNAANFREFPWLCSMVNWVITELALLDNFAYIFFHVFFV